MLNVIREIIFKINIIEVNMDKRLQREIDEYENGKY